MLFYSWMGTNGGGSEPAAGSEMQGNPIMDANNSTQSYIATGVSNPSARDCLRVQFRRIQRRSTQVGE